MTDALRSRLAADGVVGPQAALVLALAHDLPASVEVWATTSTVAELAARLEASPRTVQRLRAQLPELPYLSIISTSRGYMLRVALDGGAVTPPPKSRQDLVSPLPDPRQSPATPPPAGVTAPPIEALYDLIEWAARVADLLPDDAQLPPSLAALVVGRQSPAKGVTNPRQSPDRSTTDRRQIDDTSTSNPRQSPATSHAHARTDTPRACAPVTSRDIINNISDQSRPGLQASARTHEGTPTHEPAREGLALPAEQVEVEVDEVGQGTAELVERIQLKLVAGLDRYVQRPSGVEPGDVTDLAGQLVELLGDAAAARCYLDERLLSIADRAPDKRPTTWSYLARFLLQDATDPVIVARARAISQPVEPAAIETVTAAQLVAQVMQAQPRYQQRGPRRASEAIIFEDLYPPSPPSTPQDELDAYRAELEYQLGQPPHLRDQATVDALLAELGMSSADLSAPVAPVRISAPEANRPVVLRDEPAAPVRKSAPQPEASAVDEGPPITPASGIPAHIRDQAAALGLSFSSAPVAGPAPVADGHLWARCIQAVGKLERGAAWAQRLERAGVRVDSGRRLLCIALETEAELEAWRAWSAAEIRATIGERLEIDTGAGWRIEAELLNAQEVGT
jgi:hypothetical protein